MSKITKKPSAKQLWQLFFAFFKIGVFTFGGGFAMISLMEHEFVEKRKWVSKEDIMDMIIVSESTPGGVAINSATFIGTKMGGVFAAILATLGIVLPSFLIVAAVYFVLGSVLNNVWVAAAFKGIRICVVVLIFRAVLSLFGLMERNAYSYVMLLASFAVATFTNFNIIYMILIGGVLGVLYTRFVKKQDKLPVSNLKRDPLDERDETGVIEEKSSREDLPQNDKNLGEKEEK